MGDRILRAVANVGCLAGGAAFMQKQRVELRWRTTRRVGLPRPRFARQGQRLAALAGSLSGRETLRRSKLACRSGLLLEPPENEAVQHQGQRDGEGRYHHQRIG